MKTIMSGYNDDIHQRQIDKLKQLFPEVVTEGKIDWQKLQATLGEAVDLGERYGLGWKGKSDVFATIQEKTVQTLHPDRANSVDWDTTSNMFIEGDNLAALKILHKAYYGKVKMIYIDPPYNTGNDFIYNDDFKQTRRSYEAEAGITDDEGNVVRDDGLRTNTGGHKHSNWLNMMYPRLFLARNLLRQDGVIFVSIDDNEVHNLRLMMNEIFGEENFVAQVIWEKVHTRKNSAQYFSYNHDYVVAIARKKDEWKRKLIPRENNSAYSNPDNDPKGVWKLDPIYANNPYDADYVISKPTGEAMSRPVGRYWRFSEKVWLQKVQDNAVVWGKRGSYPMVKRYLSDVQDGLVPQTIFTREFAGDNALANTELKNILKMESLFDYPKPTQLIKRLMQISTDTNNGDIILDFFAGSGTTAHAVAELNAEDGGNRRWICVQLPELTDEESEAYRAGYRTIADIARERIRRAGAKIRADQADKLASRDVPLDLGFRAYRVDDSNFKQWNELVSDPEEIRQQALANLDPLEEGATDDDLLTELLLKRGVSPLAKIEQHDNFCFIPSEKLVICLAHSMTEELFATILATKPSSIILLDRAFGDDINLKVNLLLQAERQGVEVEVV